MVIRLGKGEKRLDARETRKHWFNLTGAKQIRMEFVKEPKDLAAYLSDQRKRKHGWRICLAGYDDTVALV